MTRLPPLPLLQPSPIRPKTTTTMGPRDLRMVNFGTLSSDFDQHNNHRNNKIKRKIRHYIHGAAKSTYLHERGFTIIQRRINVSCVYTFTLNLTVIKRHKFALVSLSLSFRQEYEEPNSFERRNLTSLSLSQFCHANN